MSIQTNMGTLQSTLSTSTEWVETPTVVDSLSFNIELPIEKTIDKQINNEDRVTPVSSIITVIEPKPSYIYMLIKDGYINFCFSEKKSDLIRTIKIYKDYITTKYMTIGSNHIFGSVNGNSYCIYERNSNFIFNYDSLITSFHIIKVPHFRTEIFSQKQYD